MSAVIINLDDYRKIPAQVALAYIRNNPWLTPADREIILRVFVKPQITEHWPMNKSAGKGPISNDGHNAERARCPAMGVRPSAQVHVRDAHSQRHPWHD